MSQAVSNTSSSRREIVMSADALLARLRTEQGNQFRFALGPATRSSASSRSVLQTLESADEADGAQADIPSQPEPVLQVKLDDIKQLVLPKEVWKLVLKNLSEADLCRVLETCRGLYQYGWRQELEPLDPNSEPGRVQRNICSARLGSILDNAQYSGDKPTAGDVRAFAQQLQTLASRYRCIQVQVRPGFEEAVCKALMAAPRWKSVALYFFKMGAADCDRSMVHRLEQGLAAQGRKADLFLNLGVARAGGLLAVDKGWAKTFCPGSALRLTGLRLDDANDSSLIELRQYLESDNSLDYLEVHGAASLLASLQKGSRRLTKLVVVDSTFKDHPAPLLETLESKEQLTRFGYCFPGFTASGLNFPALLKAAKKLEVLHLSFGSIKPGASAGTEQALKDSRLREISLHTIGVDFAHRATDQVEAMHAELFNGLRVAPRLTTLHLSLDMHKIADGAFLSAFADNPCAQTLCVDSREAAGWEAPLAIANAKRKERQLNPIDLRPGPLSIQSNESN